MEELFNGIVLPDGVKVSFSSPVKSVRVEDIAIRNHPAFNRKGSKMLVATELIKENECIGYYAGEIKYFKEDDTCEDWNPYQLTPVPQGEYYIDGQTIGNEMRFINDPRGLPNTQANAKFYQSDRKIKGFYVSAVHALKDIKKGEEILVSYGDDYWEMLKEWYEKNHPYTCSDCDYRSDKESKLYTHRYNNHNQERYICQYCDASIKHDSGFRAHLNCHTKEILYKCDFCDYTAYRNTSIMSHKQQVHSDAKWKCFECNDFFSAANCLKRHVESIHKKLKQFYCEKCEYSTYRKDCLERHFTSAHEKIELKCEYENCNFSTVYKSNLQVHIKNIHERNELHMCEYCKFSTFHKRSLKRHIQRAHEGKRYYCNECESSYTTGENLKKHKQKNHQKRDVIESDISTLESNSKKTKISND